VVDPGDPVGVWRCRDGRGLPVAQRPSEDASARPLADQSQQHARHAAHAVLDLEPELAPGGWLVGDLELLEGRHSRDAIRLGRYFDSLSWPGGVDFGAVAGAGSDADSGLLAGGAGVPRSAGAVELGALELGALVWPRPSAFA